MSSSVQMIVKLDDDNYSASAVHIKSVLIHSDLWKVTCGRVVKEENDSAEKKALFDEIDKKALASTI